MQTDKWLKHDQEENKRICLFFDSGKQKYLSNVNFTLTKWLRFFERHFGPRMAVGFADAETETGRAEDRSRPARWEARNRHRLIIAATFFATKHFVVVSHLTHSLSLCLTGSLSQLSIPIHPPWDTHTHTHNHTIFSAMNTHTLTLTSSISLLSEVCMQLRACVCEIEDREHNMSHTLTHARTHARTHSLTHTLADSLSFSQSSYTFFLCLGSLQEPVSSATLFFFCWCCSFRLGPAAAAFWWSIVSVRAKSKLWTRKFHVLVIAQLSINDSL